MNTWGRLSVLTLQRTSRSTPLRSGAQSGMGEFYLEVNRYSQKIAVLSPAYAANYRFLVPAALARQRHCQKDDGSPGRAC
jgi:hypothetical protein